MPWSSDNARSIIPILRMFDLAATRRFYIDYLGFSVVSQVGDAAETPAYWIVALGSVRLHLSTHHGDGTPGTAVLVVTGELESLHATLRTKGYPFMNPGIEPAPGGGREMIVIDPSSNTLRFYEPS
jgi:catechol 2,3-dioxygenase-like lactoylglutathione lyase family enzyme